MALSLFSNYYLLLGKTAESIGCSIDAGASPRAPGCVARADRHRCAVLVWIIRDRRAGSVAVAIGQQPGLDRAKTSVMGCFDDGVDWPRNRAGKYPAPTALVRLRDVPSWPERPRRVRPPRSSLPSHGGWRWSPGCTAGRCADNRERIAARSSTARRTDPAARPSGTFHISCAPRTARGPGARRFLRRCSTKYRRLA